MSRILALLAIVLGLSAAPAVAQQTEPAAPGAAQTNADDDNFDIGWLGLLGLAGLAGLLGRKRDSRVGTNHPVR